MTRIDRSTFFPFALLVLIFGSLLVSAQNPPPPAPPPPIPTSGIGNGSGAGYGVGSSREEEDDDVVTGATVRGKVVYSDTGRPVRYALVTLAGENSQAFSRKYVKTDGNGEFVIKNVKAGTYDTIVKSEGVLTRDSYTSWYRPLGKAENTDNLFKKLTVAGLGEIQTTIGVIRGGAIGGRIIYADGEAAVGVKVEALRKLDERFGTVTGSLESGSFGTTQADDRGVYRFSGLPEGTYLVRIIEPVSHVPSKAENIYNFRANQGSILRTYYPEGSNSKTAREIQIAPGQELTGINVVIPERRLFDISGKIVRKRDSEPLAKFTVNFYRMSDADPAVIDYAAAQRSAVTSGKSGEFSIMNLPAGKYSIMVSQPGNYRPTSQSPLTEQYPNVSKVIDIIAQDIPDLVLEVPTEAGITGVMVLAGEKDVPRQARVYVMNEKTGEIGYPDETRAVQNPENPKEKAFHIGKLKEGKYRFFSSDRDYYVKSVLNEADSGPVVDVKEGENLAGIRILLGDDVGIVKGVTAPPEAGNQVFVVLAKPGIGVDEMKGNTFTSVATPSGEFEVKAPPGEYTIFAMSSKNRPTVPAEARIWMEKMLREGQKITVRANETVTISLSIAK